MNAPDRTVLHAYGLVDSIRAPAVCGIGGAAVTVTPVGEFAVLVSHVDVETYGPDVWRSHAEDVRWLGRVAAQHHDVLQAAVAIGDVLPLRLPSLHPDRRALERALGDRTEALAAAFARIRGHIELGAKAYLVADPTDQAATSAPTSGRDYLLRRKAQAEQRDTARERRHDALVAAHHTLRAGAADARTSPPQDPALSGRAEPMVLNAAYLVSRDGVEGFVDIAERVDADLRGVGIALEVTGPWPPYNFVDSGDAADQGRPVEAPT